MGPRKTQAELLEKLGIILNTQENPNQFYLDRFRDFFNVIIDNQNQFPPKAVEKAHVIQQAIQAFWEGKIDIKMFGQTETALFHFFKALKENQTPDMVIRIDTWELQTSYALFFRLEATKRLEQALIEKKNAYTAMKTSLESESWLKKEDITRDSALGDILKECNGNFNEFKQKLIASLTAEYKKSKEIIDALKILIRDNVIFDTNTLEMLGSKSKFKYNQYDKACNDDGYISGYKEKGTGGTVTTETLAVQEFTKLYCAHQYHLSFPKDQAHDDYARHRIFMGLEPFSTLEGLKLNLNRILHRHPGKNMVLDGKPEDIAKFYESDDAELGGEGRRYASDDESSDSELEARGSQYTSSDDESDEELGNIHEKLHESSSEEDDDSELGDARDIKEKRFRASVAARRHRGLHTSPSDTESDNEDTYEGRYDKKK